MGNPLNLLVPSLALFPLNEVLIGHIKHGVDIFTGGSYRVKRPALRLDRSRQEGNSVGFEKLEHIGRHF